MIHWELIEQGSTTRHKEQVDGTHTDKHTQQDSLNLHCKKEEKEEERRFRSFLFISLAVKEKPSPPFISFSFLLLNFVPLSFLIII